MSEDIRFDLIDDDLTDEALDGERNRICVTCRIERICVMSR